MWMKAGLAVAAALCLACLAPALAGQAELAHAIYVKVNGKTITQENVAQIVKYLVRREYNGVTPEDEQELENVHKAALRDLVRTILIHDEAATLKLTVPRSQRRQLVASSGMKPEDVTPTIRRILEADYLFEEVMMASGTPVKQPSPREIKDFYTQNREEFRTNAFIIVRTIFLAADGSQSQMYFKQRAEAMIAELSAIPMPARTAAFAKKAEESSQDIFARFGGLLTGASPERWIPKDFANANPDGSPIFPPLMVEGIRRLNQQGELRLAVSADGMHILFCEDLRGGRVMPWEEASRIIEYVLRQRFRNQQMRSWINRVYDRSDIRWHDGAVYEKEKLTEVLLPSERTPQERRGG